MVVVLLDDPRSGLDGDDRRGARISGRRVAVGAAVAAVPVLLIVLQIVASRNGFEGPLHSLWNDFVGTPKSVSVPWAGLALALVGVSWRRRFIILGAALAIDAVFAVVRVLHGGPLTIGNGAVIALTGLAVVAWLGWEGADKHNALHAAALGALLILATKVGDVWLHITVLAGPNVLDRYVLLADHALGEPSWVMGRVIEAIGPVGYGVLHWVYIELPVAAMVVAAWQLRRVVSSGIWPNHYLVRTFLVLGLVGPVVYVLFPVVGPMFAFAADGHGLQIGNYWPHTVPPLDHIPAALPFDTVTPRNCMPSMHTAWATTVFLHSRRAADGSPAPRWLRWGGAFWLLATLTATLGFGYHYGADLLAGGVLCLTVESALRAPERGWDRTRIQLVAGGTALLATMLLSYRYLAVWMSQHPFPAGVILLGLFAAYVWAFHAAWFARSAMPRPVTAERVHAN
ncbi:phosphatase PAP2 family protein [Nocardia pseudobrasiliensis]|uniref:PAP2 superfamily protein n=1 Tax=Nocardia pseudobrasiliensis TaxID=45979 RepID=A0A370HN23_9NOCA|nr:phosphatase PAP2 family protein [Nocardia pseudobrasiliensis]RDI59720.1 PAP2 superfamily protein [Nocardia pseudobrasiliensis]